MTIGDDYRVVLGGLWRRCDRRARLHYFDLPANCTGIPVLSHLGTRAQRVPKRCEPVADAQYLTPKGSGHPQTKQEEVAQQGLVNGSNSERDGIWVSLCWGKKAQLKPRRHSGKSLGGPANVGTTHHLQSSNNISGTSRSFRRVLRRVPSRLEVFRRRCLN